MASNRFCQRAEEKNRPAPEICVKIDLLLLERPFLSKELSMFGMDLFDYLLVAEFLAPMVLGVYYSFGSSG